MTMWKYLPSIVRRIKHAFTNNLWKKYIQDTNFMYYFPDKFYKTIPPKVYFWQVFAIIKPNEYKTVIETARNRVISFKKIIRNNIRMTEEALEVFNDFSDDDLNLLSKLN